MKILREQATSTEDKATLDRKLSEIDDRIAEYQRKERDRQERLESERLEHERMQPERLERERADRERIEFEAKRNQLVLNGNGTLRDKSSQQAKKLIDEWIDNPWGKRWQAIPKESYRFFSAETFYRVFGKPDRTQFLSSEFEPGSYYFLYSCRDGLARIKIDAYQLDNNDIVIIQDLNIF